LIPSKVEALHDAAPEREPGGFSGNDMSKIPLASTGNRLAGKGARKIFAGIEISLGFPNSGAQRKSVV
jgi:hypothetical protein